MAIKFVDIEPEDAGKGKQATQRVSAPPAEADSSIAERPGVSPLPYAKPAPKKTRAEVDQPVKSDRRTIPSASVSACPKWRARATAPAASDWRRRSGTVAIVARAAGT